MKGGVITFLNLEDNVASIDVSLLRSITFGSTGGTIGGLLPSLIAT